MLHAKWPRSAVKVLVTLSSETKGPFAETRLKVGGVAIQEHLFTHGPSDLVVVDAASPMFFF